MSKIKVSKEIAKALNHLLYRNGAVYTKESLLATHAKMPQHDRQWNAHVSIMNTLTVMELAEILVNGYEVELNPIEQYIIELNKTTQEFKGLNGNSEYHQGKLDGMSFVAKTFNLQVKEEDVDVITCEICGRTSLNYREHDKDHPHFAAVEGHDNVCTNCFQSGIGFM